MTHLCVCGTPSTRRASPTIRGALAVAVALVGTLSCTPPNPAGEPLKGTTTGEAFEGVQCSAVRPQTEPDLMAWDPASRANLNRLRNEGLVAVHYEAKGCNVELELLSNCIAPGAYKYAPYSANETKIAKNANELFAQLPIGAARLSGKLKGDRALRTDYMLVGTASVAPGTVVQTGDLRGQGCDRANFVVSTIYLGGFAMAAGESRHMEGHASLFVAGTDVVGDASVERLDNEGNAEACRKAQSEGQESPVCAVPLRIGLLKLTDARSEAESKSPPNREARRTTAVPAGVFAIPGGLREEESDSGPAPAPTLTPSVPPAPAELTASAGKCKELAQHTAGKQGACAGGVVSLLAAAARRSSDPTALDEALALAESCPGVSPGVIRALRADLGPPACADVLVEPLLKSGGVDSETRDVLYGLAVRGRIARMSPVGFSPYSGPKSKEEVLKFVGARVVPSLAARSKTLERIVSGTERLSGYGRAIALSATALAWSEMVDSGRRTPIPRDWNRDAELRVAYYGAIDAAFEPLKSEHARPTGIAALQAQAATGGWDARSDAVRRWLEKNFRLEFPPTQGAVVLLEPTLAPPATDAEQAASLLPAWYAPRLLGDGVPTEDGVLARLRGLAPEYRKALATKGPVAAQAVARNRLLAALRFGRLADVDRALAALGSIPESARDDTVRLMIAFGLGLRDSQPSAKTISKSTLGTDTRALDALENGGGPSAAIAGGVNALLLAARASGDTAQVVRTLQEAQRKFLDAEQRLSTDAARRWAREWAQDCADTVTFLHMP